jgi:ketosteroid isomerase-like protein
MLKETPMSTPTAGTPEQICALFRAAMARRDLEAAIQLYDPRAVFVMETGEATADVRGQLAASVQSRTRFDFVIRGIAETDDVALMHTEWDVSGPVRRRVHAIEVARRQSAGDWRWLIGDPFTVGKTNDLRLRDQNSSNLTEE